MVNLKANMQLTALGELAFYYLIIF